MVLSVTPVASEVVGTFALTSTGYSSGEHSVSTVLWVALPEDGPVVATDCVEITELTFHVTCGVTVAVPLCSSYDTYRARVAAVESLRWGLPLTVTANLDE